MSRILLSAAEVGPRDRDAVADAVTSGWLSPVGPALDRFEQELAQVTGRQHTVGLPSVVVDNPSNREWIEHGRTGWPVASGDPAALAAALILARCAFSELLDMAERGRARVERDADWDMHALTLVRTLEGVAMRR